MAKPKNPQVPTAAASPEAAPPAHASAGPLIVGVGASAGGLEALRALVEAMPASPGLSLVHIQHLDPTHKSMMAELLSTATSMKVLEAGDGMPIELDHVYIGPPTHDVEIVGGKLHLVPRPDGHGRLPIDFFLRSLAREAGDRAVAVILSGTGTDGMLGVRAVKGAGGTTIAQEPSNAKYDGMPRAAIGTQLVDFVAPAKEIPRILGDYVKHPYLVLPEAPAPPTARGQLEQIFRLLREHTGHDFAHYKQTTIRRRIERRMAVLQQRQLDDYVERLRRSPAEVEALFHDLLIGVTNFFRDQDAFHAVEERVVPRLVETSAQAGQLRVWVPGCSTGEEAYSLAMLFAERMERTREKHKVCVFATDIDPGAIDVARAAVYPDAIAADVSPERLAHLFTAEKGTYRISKRIREMVIFAVQDVLKDPPFSRIDLVSCRNLLIYLEPELQRRLMQLFHAVLNPGGFLFLGASETVGDAGDLFTQVDKRWKIFEKRAVPTHPLIGVTSLHSLNEVGRAAPRSTEQAAEPRAQPALADLTTQLILDSYAPPCVVVDENYDVLYLQGRTSRFLELPSGEPQLNVLKMARDELLRELRAALHLAAKEHSEVVREHVTLIGDGEPRVLRLRVKPFRGARPSQHLLLVAFEETHPEASEGEPGRPPPDPCVVELTRKLHSMKESLQSTVEEVESSNEELHSANEELQSANEELQSTNEELETSKEELQSVNEELMTVNNELQKKLEELSQANNDLTNLLDSTEIGTVFLDNELRLKRFTPAVGKLVNLIPSDVGRPVSDIVTQIVDDDLTSHAREVLRTLLFHESEVRTRDGRAYLRRILPYRTTDNVIDGVVVTFVNITEVREAQRMVEAMLLFANSIFSSVRQPILVLNKEGRVVQVNDAYYHTFHARREETLGALIHEVGGGRWGAPDVRAAFAAVVAGGAPIDRLEVVQEVPGLGRRTLRLYAQWTAFGTKAVAGEDELTVVTVEDAGAAAS
jgi:two-component system CheB/CheR fusion protein